MFDQHTLALLEQLKEKGPVKAERFLSELVKENHRAELISDICQAPAATRATLAGQVPGLIRLGFSPLELFVPSHTTSC